MAAEVGGYYGYALYDECFYENDFAAARPPRWAARLFPPDRLRPRYGGPDLAAAGRRRAGAGAVGERTPGYPCGGEAVLAAWAAAPEVLIRLVFTYVPAICKIRIPGSYRNVRQARWPSLVFTYVPAPRSGSVDACWCGVAACRGMLAADDAGRQVCWIWIMTRSQRRSLLDPLKYAGRG
jgi:hypothetical protein